MDETLWRALVVLVVGGAAVLWGLVARQGRALRRHTVKMPGIDPGLYLFTSEVCMSCPRARLALESSGVEWTEISYQEAPGYFTDFGVNKVPTVALLGADGAGWAASGIPQRVLLRRWLSEGP